MRVRFYLLMTIALSLLPVVSILSSGQLFHTHDGFVHLARMSAFFKSLSDGQFPVRWAGELNFGYGMPLFDFIYQLPYFISSFFLLLGFGLVASFELTLVLSFILSGIFMFLFAREFFGDAREAFLVTIFYQFFPFRLIELFVRGSFGEVYAYTFLPLVLYGIVKIFHNQPILYYRILTAFATAFLVLSHNSVSLLFFSVIVGFVLVFGKSKEKIITAGVSLGLGILLSAFYWFPAMYDHKFTYGDLYMTNLYKEHFAPIQNFFIPNLTNATPLQTGGIAVSFGLMQIITFGVVVWLFWKNKIEKQQRKIVVAVFALLVISLFFMQPSSYFLWDHVAILRQFQFPWRFLAVCGFGIALLSPLLLRVLPGNRAYWIIIAITVLSTFVYWRPVLGYDKIDENYYWNFPLNTTYYGETDVIWSAGPAKNYPKQSVEFAVGTGSFGNYLKKSSIHSYTVEALKDSVISDNTVYFPGWRAYVDGKEVPIEFQDQNWRGIITFPVKKGAHAIRVEFTETKPRMAADLVSLGALLFLCGMLVLKHYEKK